MPRYVEISLVNQKRMEMWEVYRTILMIVKANFQLRWAKWCALNYRRLERSLYIINHVPTINLARGLWPLPLPDQQFLAINIFEQLWYYIPAMMSSHSYWCNDFWDIHAYDVFVFNFSLLHYYWASILTEGHSPALTNFEFFIREIFFISF